MADLLRSMLVAKRSIGVATVEVKEQQKREASES